MNKMLRGRGACPNTLLIPRRAIEEQLLAGLQAKVLHPDVMAYTLDRFESELYTPDAYRWMQTP